MAGDPNISRYVGNATPNFTDPSGLYDTPAGEMYQVNSTGSDPGSSRIIDGVSSEQEEQILGMFNAVYGEEGSALLDAFIHDGNTVVVEDLWFSIWAYSDIDYDRSRNRHVIQLDDNILDGTESANPAVAAHELYNQLLGALRENARGMRNRITARLLDPDYSNDDFRALQDSYEAAASGGAQVAATLSEMYVTGLVEWTPGGWVITTTYYVGEGENGKAATAALPGGLWGLQRGARIRWSGSAVRNAASALELGVTEIRVARRSQAEELFLGIFQGQGYRNTTGLGRQIYGELGTYHWDDVFGAESKILPGNRVLAGHYDDGNLHNYVPHLQIHTFDDREIRILYDE